MTGHAIPRDYDVVIVGGGPSGATAGMVLARAGVSTLVVEGDAFPRFHIGESLLPRNMRLLRELGLEERVKALPSIAKHGVEFTFGHTTESRSIAFVDGLEASEPVALNVERAPFDALLLDEARNSGAEICSGSRVRDVVRLEDGDCVLSVGERQVSSRYVIDASGQATFLGKRLGLRKVLPDMRKVSYYGHFENVTRHEGKQEGYPALVMMKDAWFWIIPLDEKKTSIGLVMDHEDAKKVGLPPERMLEWAIARCPVLKQRTADAVFPDRYEVGADFSYRCAPYAGPGYFLVGDAATFVDPVFSTGVCLGMASAARAADDLIRVLRGETNPDAARKGYIDYVEGSCAVLFKLVRHYYTHPFRELWIRGEGPFGIHRALISILAGEVFPRPSRTLMWRYWLFELAVRLQRRFPIAPRHEAFALIDGGATGPLPDFSPIKGSG